MESNPDRELPRSQSDDFKLSKGSGSSKKKGQYHFVEEEEEGSEEELNSVESNRRYVEGRTSERKSYLDKAKLMYLRTKRNTLIDHLMEYDREKSGSFPIDQVADIIEELEAEKEESARKNKVIILLAASVVFLTVAVLGAVIVGNEITKESVVKDGMLESAATGDPVSTGTITEYKSVADLLTIDATKAVERLEAMTFFPMVMGPGSIMWLTPTAFRVEFDDMNSTRLISVTIYSGFGQHALKMNATDLYYQTETDIWESTSLHRRSLRSHGGRRSINHWRHWYFGSRVSFSVPDNPGQTINFLTSVSDD